MSNFELGYCPITDYREGEGDRLMEDELSIAGLYQIMLRLEDDRAATYPSILRDIEPQGSGLYSVRFTIINAELGPDLDTQSGFHNGYWLRGLSNGIKVDETLVETGYFKGYDNELEDELQAIVEAELVIH